MRRHDSQSQIEVEIADINNRRITGWQQIGNLKEKNQPLAFTKRIMLAAQQKNVEATTLKAAETKTNRKIYMKH